MATKIVGGPYDGEVLATTFTSAMLSAAIENRADGKFIGTAYHRRNPETGWYEFERIQYYYIYPADPRGEG